MKGKKFPVIYTRSNNLKRHIDSVHKQIKEFPCEYCEETFVRAAVLDKHKNKYCKIKFMMVAAIVSVDAEHCNNRLCNF